ncbi:hypothetical protein F4810DRAFT_708101 [Camillea tinctor]|nr:hypothetical protein F4810DRAFT_708101 [Camillea tinctor]
MSQTPSTSISEPTMATQPETRATDVSEPETFVFVVGGEGREFTVDKKALRSLSPYFRVLMDGNMKEAAEGRALWSDVDVPTFERLLQFAQTRDYEVYPLPITLPAGGLNSKLPSDYLEIGLKRYQYGNCLWIQLAEMFVKVDIDTIMTDITGGDLKPNPPMTHFARDFFALLRKGKPWSQADQRSMLRLDDPCRDFQFNLFCTVKVYILADTYGILGLLHLALYRFGETLLFMNPEHFDLLLAVAVYIFENTLPKDAIRRALALYMVCMRFVEPKAVDLFLHKLPELAGEIDHLTKEHVTYHI